MLKYCKSPNSKCFLLTYLALVVFLLVLWRSGSESIVSDQREIPSDLSAYLLSPPTEISSAALKHKQVLTTDLLPNKWSFIYFSHHQCLPACAKPLKIMGDLRENFSANNIQFLVIELDPDRGSSPDKLAKFLDAQGLGLTAVTASMDVIRQVTAQFKELFLITNFADGSYQTEQQHQIFIVDPKGRVYAKFKPPHKSATIQKAFVSMRLFYAQTG